tara:strand:- start:117 stop:956 length:840 start_codon:yes stop_codon:yes gene_type:complete
MIIWLASYPKSGNTWLRSIICSLLYTKDGRFSFDLIKKIPQFPVEKNFKDFTDKFTDINEIKKYWIPAQNKINLDNKVKFIKTHHLNVKLDKFNFTDPRNTCGTIYIVRDPRNLINSISNHYSKTPDEAKNFLTTPRLLGAKRTSSNKGHVVTLLGNWAEHYRYWKEGSKNFLLIKYEDLLQNPEIELDRLILFIKKYINFEINNNKIKNIIETTSFGSLKKMEKEGLFNENVLNSFTKAKVDFFNQGPNNKWQNTLNLKIQKELEIKFEKEMKDLKYL